MKFLILNYQMVLIFLVLVTVINNENVHLNEVSIFWNISMFIQTIEKDSLFFNKILIDH